MKWEIMRIAAFHVFCLASCFLKDETFVPGATVALPAFCSLSPVEILRPAHSPQRYEDTEARKPVAATRASVVRLHAGPRHTRDSYKSR